MPKKDFEEKNTWLNDSICGHLQRNILQNPEASTGKSGKHIWSKLSDLNTDARSMSNKWSKRMALIFAISIAVGPCVCHMQVGPQLSSKIRGKLQILLKMLPGGPYTPNLETGWKKKKKLFKKARKKKNTHLHMYIWTSSGKQISYEMDGQSCTTVLNSSWKPQGCFPLPAWSKTFQEVGNNHRRKFTGGALTWYCHLDAWKPEASLELRRKWRTPFCF